MEQAILKNMLKHNYKSFIAVLFIGIFAGLLVVLFSDFPSGTLWSFSSFSSSTIGFWMFSTSTIVLFSEKRLTAGINAGLYVFLIFVITGIYKFLRSYLRGYSGTDSIFSQIPQIILYAIIPAVVCSILGLILWHGRSNTWLGKLLLLLPFIVILFETVLMFKQLIIQRTMLFQVLIDSVCAVIYFFIFKKAIFSKPTKII